jgi:hypothetical protein
VDKPLDDDDDDDDVLNGFLHPHYTHLCTPRMCVFQAGSPPVSEERIQSVFMEDEAEMFPGNLVTTYEGTLCHKSEDRNRHNLFRYEVSLLCLQPGI